MVIFHLDLDCFFVGVERVLEPSLVGRAVVVGGRADTRGVVASASYEARRFGVHAGMPLAQARRLCPQAVFLEGRYHYYEQFSDRFFRILGDFTPDIESGGIDEAYGNMTGFEPFYGPPREAARRLKDQVRQELGLTCTIGIAASKVVAKVASDLAKPDGLLEVPAGGEAAFLAPLPVEKLPGVGHKTAQVLQGLGVRTLGELAALPVLRLKKLFGAWGVALHRLAQGRDLGPLGPLPSAKSISRSTTFARDTLDRAFLEAVLAYLSQRVGRELRETGKQARLVFLKLRYSDFETLSRQQVLPQPTDMDQVIFEVGRTLLLRQLKQRRELVRLVGVGAGGLVAGRQLPLWPDSLGELNRVLDRLRQKYGFPCPQTGRTLRLREAFPQEKEGYVLHTPCLTR